MSEHPGDSATNRFRAFWAGLLAFVSFGVVLWIALNAASPGDAVEPGWAERGELRKANLTEVRAAQAAVVSRDSIEKAKKGTLAMLSTKKAAKSDQVVPGSPTFMKQSQEAAAPAAPAPASAEPKAAPAPAPAPTTPAEKPAIEKPAAEAPKPEEPAAK